MKTPPSKPAISLPPAINPWDIAPLSDADETADQVYLSVGKALTAWEDLEHQLARFFTFFVTDGAADDMMAYRAYGSAVAFRARLEMLEAASEAYFSRILPDVELETRFKALLREAGKFSPRRNEIAHGRVRPIGKPSLHPEDLMFDDMGWCLYPSEYSKNKNTLQEPREDKAGSRELFPRYLYSSKEIDAYASNFRDIGNIAVKLIFDWLDKYPDAGIYPQF